MEPVTSGFYWVKQHERSQKITIARLTKNSGWEYLASEHSSKAIRNSPYKIIQKIEYFGEN